MAKRFRNVVFTINNPSAEDDKLLLEAALDKSITSYVCIGEEVGESGTKHYQGYWEFAGKMGAKKIKLVMPRAWYDVRAGTAQKASDYCKKGEQSKEEWKKQGTAGPNYGKNASVTEHGQMSKPGKRSDLEDVATMILAGKRVREVADEYPVQYIKFHKGIEKLRGLQIPVRDKAPEVIVLYGKTGTGKSKMAREMCPEAYIWGPEQGKWWDGYDGETEVILEEFRGQLPFGYILRLLDRYGMRVETKGSTVQFCATKIIITSPVHWKEWYNVAAFAGSGDKVDQLDRRITETQHLQIFSGIPKIGEKRPEVKSVFEG